MWLLCVLLITCSPFSRLGYHAHALLSDFHATSISYFSSTFKWPLVFFYRRCMRTCWWSCPLPASSSLNFWARARMWTSTIWHRWTRRCIATSFSSRAMKAMLRSWASTSRWSTMTWEKLRWWPSGFTAVRPFHSFSPLDFFITLFFLLVTVLLRLSKLRLCWPFQQTIAEHAWKKQLAALKHVSSQAGGFRRMCCHHSCSQSCTLPRAHVCSGP